MYFKKEPRISFGFNCSNLCFWTIVYYRSMIWLSIYMLLQAISEFLCEKKLSWPYPPNREEITTPIGCFTFEYFITRQILCYYCDVISCHLAWILNYFYLILLVPMDLMHSNFTNVPKICKISRLIKLNLKFL